ncbi:hypothetical protein CVT24_013109 [Panaeolus cyanescens]|uniref:MPN domain-containing protein n=1 Tax=Panaeolus cyanescens TaxID=181874 RepID=A0A409YN46_9AGAR|nr:hypothetical protein CVT24_013109 [Panaeolus cyanescens]
MSTSYTVSPTAYFKIYLHGVKHPSKPVNGVLLGTASSTATGKLVEIQDAIPLLHHWTSLSPMMEIGLDLAAQHASSENMQIVGYYQASDRIDDTTLAVVGEKVAGRIRKTFPDAIAFVVDGSRFGSGEQCLVPYIFTPSSIWRPASDSSQIAPWTSSSPFQLSDPSTPQKALELVKEQNAHFAFGDFDDHLEDVTIGTPFC